MKIQDRHRDYIPVYSDGSWDGTVFPPDTVISMMLPDSVSIFTAKIWAIITTLEQIKDSVESQNSF